MSDIGLGKLITTTPLPSRDAVHIACVPLICGEDWMAKGQLVRLKLGTKDTIVSAEYLQDKAIGVIDPFIDSYNLTKGSVVWVMLMPNTVTGVTHVYHHPLLDSPLPEFTSAEKWLMDFAEKNAFDYDEMVEVAINPDAKSPEGWPNSYITARGKDLHSKPEEYEEFWKQLGELKGTVFNEEHQDKVGWSCSC